MLILIWPSKAISVFVKSMEYFWSTFRGLSINKNIQKFSLIKMNKDDNNKIVNVTFI